MVAYVQAHPGCRSLEIERAVGVGHTSGLLIYCVNKGLLHQSGRPRFFGYYTSEAEAWAHDEENKRRAAQEIAERKRDERRRASQRRRAVVKKFAHKLRAKIGLSHDAVPRKVVRGSHVFPARAGLAILGRSPMKVWA